MRHTFKSLPTLDHLLSSSKEEHLILLHHLPYKQKYYSDDKIKSNKINKNDKYFKLAIQSWEHVPKKSLYILARNCLKLTLFGIEM
jgi:hypothetical protein